PVNDEYILKRDGETKGRDLVRVVAEGPRSIAGVGGLAEPSGDFGGYNTQYTQDVVYSYYRVVPFSDTWLEGRVYDKDNPNRAIGNLALRLKASGSDKDVSAAGGRFRVQHPLRP